MPRIDDYLDLVADPEADALTPGHPADDALISLLAHVAFSDGLVDDAEVDFLLRLFPGRDPDELREWAATAGSGELDLDAVADALPTTEERWTGLRFAARMAWKDGVLTDEEMAFLSTLARRLALPDGALDRVIGETVARTRRAPDPTRVREILEGIKWRAVLSDERPLTGPLGAVVPDGAVGVGRIGLEQVEMLGFYDLGLAGRFREGMAFLEWADIVAYSRVPVLGASVILRTESGHAWTLVDRRLNGLTTFLDRLFDVDDDEPRDTQPPVIRQVRGA
jgi:hypothetical protein